MLQRRFSKVIVQDTEIAPTIEAGGGEGGNNLPKILSYGFDSYNQAIFAETSQTLKEHGGGDTYPKVLVMTYQTATGTLSPGAHPGSYNGQDALSDMLVTDGVLNSKIGDIQSVQPSAHTVSAGLQGRNRPYNRGGW